MSNLQRQSRKRRGFEIYYVLQLITFNFSFNNCVSYVKCMPKLCISCHGHRYSTVYCHIILKFKKIWGGEKKHHIIFQWLCENVCVYRQHLKTYRFYYNTVDVAAVRFPPSRHNEKHSSKAGKVNRTLTTIGFYREIPKIRENGRGAVLTAVCYKMPLRLSPKEALIECEWFVGMRIDLSKEDFIRRILMQVLSTSIINFVLGASHTMDRTDPVVLSARIKNGKIRKIKKK